MTEFGLKSEEIRSVLKSTDTVMIRKLLFDAIKKYRDKDQME